jgi:hypothetical protein
LRADLEGTDRIVILGVNKALRESGRTVEEAFSSGHFDIILISITEEEVDGLRKYIENPVEVEMDDVEIIYEYFMKNFGDTSIPPEAYITAIKMADKNGVEVRGIDIPSGEYEDVFIDNVQLSDMLLLSLRRRRLLKKRWDLSDLDNFITQWDSYVNKGGYLKVEKERAKHMAAEIVNRKRGNTLVVVESERFNDLLESLSSTLQGYTLQENVGGKRAVSSGGLSQSVS